MSRLHRGRKILQRALYNHALAMGSSRVKNAWVLRGPLGWQDDAVQSGGIPCSKTRCRVTTNGCRDRSRVLDSYLDGELEGRKMLELDEHVSDCESCREEIHLLRATRGSLKRAVIRKAPDDLRLAHCRRPGSRTGSRLQEVPMSRTTRRGWRRKLRGKAGASCGCSRHSLCLGRSYGRSSPRDVNAGAKAGFGDELLKELVLDTRSRSLLKRRT